MIDSILISLSLPTTNKEILYEEIEEMKEKARQSRKHRIKKRDSGTVTIFGGPNYSLHDPEEQKDFLISRPNTACFAALAFGVPVFITRRLRGFLPPKVSRNLFSEDWFFCNDAVELSGNIENTLKSKNKYNFKNFDDRKKLLNKHFMPINKENIINFLR